MNQKIFREPLLYFLLLGGLIFWCYSLFGNSSEEVDTRTRITISQGQQQSLLQGFEKIWQRQPTDDEMRNLMQGYVKEEVLYREALAMGLDQNDSVIRRRLGQKMTFLSEDLAALTDPGDEVLQAYLDGNPEPYRKQSQISFRQIYFDVTNPESRNAADSLLNELRLQDRDISDLGDALMLPSRFELASEHEIGRTFGQRFLENLTLIPRQSWQGPVESGFGIHLVHIDEFVEGRKAELVEVRDQVYRDWSAEQRDLYNAAFYDAVSQKYDVTIEPSPGHTGNEPVEK